MNKTPQDILLDSATNVAIIATNIEGVITVFNKGAEQLLGYKASDIIGSQTPLFFHDTAELEAFAEFMAADQEQRSEGFEIFKEAISKDCFLHRQWHYQCQDGQAIPVQLSANTMMDENNDTVGFLFMASKPIEVIPVNQAKLHRPMLESLTELPDKEVFERVLNREFRRAQRGEYPITVIKLDVDHYKNHLAEVGEEKAHNTLRMIAHVLNDRIQRAGDFLAYCSQDSFAVILPNTDIPGTVKVAEFVRLMVENINIPCSKNSKTDYITLSTGIAYMIPSRTDQPHELVNAADRALQQAKNDGRNCSRIFEGEF